MKNTTALRCAMPFIITCNFLSIQYKQDRLYGGEDPDQVYGGKAKDTLAGSFGVDPDRLFGITKIFISLLA